MPDTELMTINMGPSHPSTHGVLRLIIELDGETVVKCTPDIGYLHRGVEKLCEYKTYNQCIPLTDRLDYLAPMSNNLGYVLAVEKLLDVEIPQRAQYIRVLMTELTRISSHLLWLATHALDIGAMTVYFYAFRERESLYDLFEMVAGARMNVTYVRIGGLAADLPAGFVEKARDFIDKFPGFMDTYENLLTKNQIWINRTKNVGVISKEDAVAMGLSGPSIRGSGVNWDVRKSEPYSAYNDFDFKVPVFHNGDVYDRYLVRIEELRQSNEICRQVLDKLPEGEIKTKSKECILPDKQDVRENMEALIYHFKIITEGICPPEGEVYLSIEAPKGELGYYLVSDGSDKPARFRIRPPSFVNMKAFTKMVEGQLLADVVAIIGSLDIVLGEIDR